MYLGALRPFVIFTYKNLKYTKTAKQLIALQALWTLFFSQFQFTLAYQPGPQNNKTDSLSCLYPAPPKETLEECILLSQAL